MNWIIRSLFSLALLGTFSLAQAQEIDTQNAFRDLKALKGTWFMPTERGDRLEVWQLDNDSTLSAKAFRIKPENGDSVLLETILLTWRDTSIVYSVSVRGQNNNKAIDFRLTEAYSDEFVFENPKHDDPQKIRYVLLGNRELQVTTEGKKNGRTVSKEYVFEREFSPVSTEFRLRAGVNAASLKAERDLNLLNPDPDFGYRPGWEVALSSVFKGRGGFLALHTELGLAGKNPTVATSFLAPSDTTAVNYERDGNYRSAWMTLAVFPEYTFRRDGKLSAVVGPYYARLLNNRMNGTERPENTNSKYKTNKDLKKNDFGLMAGLHYRLKITKKDLGGKLGLRANIGLINVDDLYIRRCTNPTLCRERILLRSFSAYYSINLTQL